MYIYIDILGNYETRESGDGDYTINNFKAIPSGNDKSSRN